MLTPEKRTPEVEYTLFKELRQELKSVTVVKMPWRVTVLVTHGVVQSQWPSCNLGATVRINSAPLLARHCFTAG
jgi:hypothetical protein